MLWVWPSNSRSSMVGNSHDLAPCVIPFILLILTSFNFTELFGPPPPPRLLRFLIPESGIFWTIAKETIWQLAIWCSNPKTFELQLNELYRGCLIRLNLTFLLWIFISRCWESGQFGPVFLSLLWVANRYQSQCISLELEKIGSVYTA